MLKLQVLVAVVLLLSCNRHRNHPGHSYFDDMGPSDAYEHYSPNPNYPDGKTAQAPAVGSIARGYIPYAYPKTPDGQALAGEELRNPVLYSEGNLEVGKMKYDIYCGMCHGDKGAGDGYLFTTGKFRLSPTDLTGEYVQNQAEGEIYHVITLGSQSGFMGAHGPQIKPDDRWRIVHYIKNGFKTK